MSTSIRLLAALRSATTAVVIAGCSTQASSPPTATTREPSPTVQPTATGYPGPTPEATRRPRDVVQLNSSVVERPGVPPDLRDRYWFTANGDAGQVGTTAQIGLPAGEQILTVANGIIVSARGDADRPTDLIVREFATGHLVRVVPTAVAWPRAVLVGRRLFWAGQTPRATDDASVTDGGVWSTAVDEQTEPVAVVQPGSKVGSVISGRTFVVSPSGQTIAAVMSTVGGRLWTDVIDVESSESRRIAGRGPWAITDGVAVAWDSPPTDAPYYGYGITASSIRTGNVLWRFPDPSQVDHFVPNRIAALGSQVFVEYQWEVGDDVEQVVAVFAPLTGDRRELSRGPSGEQSLQLLPGISSEAHLAYGHGYTAGDLVQQGDEAVSILDVATGSLSRDAFVIDTPWICFPEYCVDR